MIAPSPLLWSQRPDSQSLGSHKRSCSDPSSTGVVAIWMTLAVTVIQGSAVGWKLVSVYLSTLCALALLVPLSLFIFD